MKRSIRLPFALLLLISACIVLTLSTASRRRVESGSPAGKPSLADPATNDTLLLKLAAEDPADATMSANVADLLNVNFPAVYGVGRHRSIYVWRRENQHYHNHHDLDDHRVRSAGKYPIRFRSAKDLRSFPEFRRSLRDWHRRRRFQPSVMSELLDLVKRHIECSPGHRYGSCAVVGNSGILLEKTHGGLIDGHDLVVRLNNARIDGYERHVGSKTDLSFVNSNILHLCARRESCFCHPYGESTPIIMYICQPLHFLDYALCNSSHKAPLLVTDPRLDVLCARIVRYYSLKRFSVETGRPLEEWAKAHDERAFHYSSGMQAIVLALGICDRVSVFGFGKPFGTKHHYHTNQKAELKLHDYEAEYEFYRDLTDRPQVIPFLKDSGFKVPPVVFYNRY